MNPQILWRKWTLACAAGELIGIGTAALVAKLLISKLGEPNTAVQRWTFFIVMIGAGVIEGAALGYFQWRVLHHVFPRLQARHWVGATLAVAVAGWFFGLLPSTLASDTAANPPFNPSIALIVALALLSGIGAGLIFGAAQWLVLRRHTEHAWIWIIANMLGWMVALAWIYLAASLPSEQTAPSVVVVLGILGGIGAGLSLGAITGWFLLKIIRPATSLTTSTV